MDAMSFFAMQYQVLFHDTMAYGSQHYLVNLKFQNIARETILFESQVEGGHNWTDQLKDIVMFTRKPTASISLRSGSAARSPFFDVMKSRRAAPCVFASG